MSNVARTGCRPRRAFRRLATALAVAVAAGGSAERARAQVASVEQERLLPRMARAPTDYDVAFEYYRASLEARDYEAAIGVLDRMLFYNPDLTRAKYELGALYYRLGSYGMASQYFRMALADPNADPATQAGAEALLPNAEKQLEQSRWSGFFQAGFRVQSNASFIPDRTTIRLGGQDLFLTPPGRRRGDTNFFFLFSLANDYDFQTQRGDLLETRVSGLATKQFTFGQYDIGLVDASFGPRLALDPEALAGVSVKPYVAAGVSFVGGGYYTSSGGGGLTLRVPAGQAVTLDPFVEVRAADFANGFFAPAATSASGTAVISGIAGTATVTDSITVETRGVFTQADSRFRFQTYGQYSGEFAVNLRFDPPFEAIPFRWTLSPFGKVSWTDFDGPNPFVDPNVRRRDFEYRAGFVLDMPITANFGLSSSVWRSRLDSNLPNYRVQDTSFLIGPTARF